MVASTQLAEEERARMCMRGHKDVLQKRGGCSLIRYGTKEG